MTQTAPESTAAAQNGKPAPTPGPAAAEECVDCTPASERLMGALGLLFAVALGVIALDLLTGGKLAALLPAGDGSGDGAGA